MSRKIVFTIHFIGWELHIKKEVNYKQRCEQKRAFFTKKIQNILPERLVYIDETGVIICLHYVAGHYFKGFTSFTEALGFRTKRITLIGGYCYGNKELIAPMEHDGYTNSDVFLAWIEFALCKELKPNQVVIIDNANLHKSA